MGVATGQTLETLALHPNFLIEGSPGARDERSIFPNGAVLLGNGTVAVTCGEQLAIETTARFPPIFALDSNLFLLADISARSRFRPFGEGLRLAACCDLAPSRWRYLIARVRKREAEVNHV